MKDDWINVNKQISFTITVQDKIHDLRDQDDVYCTRCAIVLIIIKFRVHLLICVWM